MNDIDMTNETNTTPPTLMELIVKYRAGTDKSDDQLAQELGLADKSVMELITAGSIRLPFGRLIELETALGGQPTTLLSAAVIESSAEALAALDSWWKAMVVSSDEALLVETYREACLGDKKPISIKLPGATVVIVPELSR